MLVAMAIVFTVALVLFSVRGIPPNRAPLHVGFGRGPKIVLLHGLGSRIQHWLPAARELARRHRVILVQLPGHGQSAMPEPFSLSAAVEALDHALAAESKEPVVLVGHSVGGLLAAALALEHPERVLGLVLVETALRPQVDGAEREGMLEALERDYASLLRTAYTSFGRDSAQGALLHAEAAENDSAMMKRWIRLALTADLSIRMRALEAPVLAVLAARSWPSDEPWPATSRALGYDEIRRLQPLRVEGAGHFVMLDRPVELAAAIERFNARLDVQLIAER
jgi:pimeloyl-ACP methyl ester carboxylesterase